MRTKLIISISTLVFWGACKMDKKEAETVLSGILPDIQNEIITLIPVQDYFPGLSFDAEYPTTETDSVGKFHFDSL
jgi:hypothetical protein